MAGLFSVNKTTTYNLNLITTMVNVRSKVIVTDL